MFTKRTIIGIIIGSVIISIGTAALVMAFGLHTLNVDETISTGQSLPYTITAPASTSQSMSIVGDKFDLTLSSPGDGLQIPLTSFKDQHDIEWTHVQDGTTTITIQNTGSIQLNVTAVLQISSSPIEIPYHFLVITSGVIIIGFSLGFSIRKPKGF